MPISHHDRNIEIWFNGGEQIFPWIAPMKPTIDKIILRSTEEAP